MTEHWLHWREIPEFSATPLRRPVAETRLTPRHNRLYLLPVYALTGNGYRWYADYDRKAHGHDSGYLRGATGNRGAYSFTRGDGDRIETDEGTIEALPIRKILLDLPDSKE